MNWIRDRLPLREGKYTVLVDYGSNRLVQVTAVWNGRAFVSNVIPSNATIIAWKK